jgi:hypothetical protein
MGKQGDGNGQEIKKVFWKFVCEWKRFLRLCENSGYIVL